MGDVAGAGHRGGDAGPDQLECWRSAYRGIVPDAHLDGLRAEDRVERFRARLGLPGPGATWVAVTESGTIAAYATVVPARDDRDPVPGMLTGELASLYAAPEFHGSGAGSAVQQAGLAHLAAEGFRHAVVWVFRDNPGARRFYERTGWACDEVTKDAHIGGAPTPEIRYSRALQFSST
ncbi:GNAT family N-acetyltransferase [Amycolatopsis thermalba]|uniref:GNAT family N-acetyltransferase n=1 Tax=Amycolatopsis thermalba TaxID=944492 RepID=A0ABY4NVV3_9PSEU|nr:MULTISPECIES: GNAT family N-acetyltransferase [Amycolatopsis]UQS24205.1 GNAT family N-acetyltransferase [Amycolatopsis thermalba]